MNKLIVESDSHGWLELDEPVTVDFAALIRREFRRIPWPPVGINQIMGYPVEIVDRRPPKPTTRRILIDAAYPKPGQPTRPDPGRRSI